MRYVYVLRRLRTETPTTRHGNLSTMYTHQLRRKRERGREQRKIVSRTNMEIVADETHRTLVRLATDSMASRVGRCLIGC